MTFRCLGPWFPVAEGGAGSAILPLMVMNADETKKATVFTGQAFAGFNLVA